MNSSRNEPYLGSVLFFKHMILLTLLLMILVPTCLSIFFGITSYRQKVAINELSSQLNTISVDIAPSNVLEPDATPTATPLSDIPGDVSPLEFETPYYQDLYPDLYDTLPEIQYSATEPTVYLTFDDGPSYVTAEVLDVLKEKDVKATFFVMGTGLESESGQALLKRIADEGHTIAVHTYSHDFTQVYASVESFLDDFYQVWAQIKEITGVSASIFRFPGGSINVYNASISQDIISEMLRRGYVYYDWNASADDAVSSTAASASSIFTAATSTRGYTRVILLMHDSYAKDTTAEALPDIIDYYLEMGYAIAPLTKEVTPVVYNYLY